MLVVNTLSELVVPDGLTASSESIIILHVFGFFLVRIPGWVGWGHVWKVRLVQGWGFVIFTNVEMSYKSS